ncbi:3749_t:CDS:2, partial [Ambispora gerdemannii]
MEDTEQEYIETMEVSIPFHMLPTPEGSDNSGGAGLILSPYDMMSTSGHVYAEDIFHEEDCLFQLEPAVLSGTSAPTYTHSYLTNTLLSPQSSPTLSPDVNISSTTTNSFSRQNNNISKSMLFRNNNNSSNGHYQHRYTPMKPKSMSTNSIMSSASGPPYNPATVSNMMAAVSAAQQRQNHLQTATNKSLNKQIFISPSLPPQSPSSNNQQQKATLVMTPAVSTQPLLFISPNGMGSITLSPVMTPTIGSGSSSGGSAAAVSSNNNSSPGSGRKSNRQNTNSLSPVALGPTAAQTRSPQALKPTISPNLKPKLSGALADEVAEQLAQKSNYQNILEGTAQSLGISYSSDLQSSLESRRTTHKAAEQKRRDSLKQCFDELKRVVPYKSMLGKNIIIANSNNDDGDNSSSGGGGKNGDGTMKNVSKLFLLKRAHDHIVELQEQNKDKDNIIAKLMKELETCKGKSSNNNNNNQTDETMDGLLEDGESEF